MMHSLSTMKIKVIHSARKHASKQVPAPGAVVHKLLTVYTQAKKILTIHTQIYPHPPITKILLLSRMHSSFSPLSRWRVHPLMP
jgi:hypothetical protein